jgi:hypothetical protein
MIFLLLAGLLAAQTPAPQNVSETTGSLRGSVVAADTGKPLQGVEVLAVPSNSSKQDAAKRVSSPDKHPGWNSLVV